MRPEVNLHIFAVFPDGEVVRTGRLLSRNLDRPGQHEGFFRYDPDYLGHPLAYAVDPVHLPLAETIFSATNRETGLHDVFEDSLPDAWGRQLLARKGGLDRGRHAPAHLLAALRGNGLGRLLFSETATPPPFLDASIPFADIGLAITEAGRLEASVDADNTALRHLLACGSSAGGARPKVLTALDDTLWIAKFAARRDPDPGLFIGLEAAGLTLAAMAGLVVPEIRRVLVGDRQVLLIRRFDISGRRGRNALLSFRSLIGIEDQYGVAYADLAAMVRQYSSSPAADLEQLYRQMLVNVLLVNTDDHLQNLAMLHTETGWRLSPAYDIVPNIYQTEQILRINARHDNLGPADLLAEGRKFGLPLQRCKKMIRDVLDRMTDWEEIFTDCEVPEAHTGRLRGEIRARMAKFRNL